MSLSEKIDTTSAAGKMVFRMLVVLAEFERDQISERTCAALQYKKSIGERTGGVPYGFTLHADGVRLVSSASEAGLVNAAKEFKAQGLSLRKIGSKLLELGYQPRGKEFYAKTIRCILAQELVCQSS